MQGKKPLVICLNNLVKSKAQGFKCLGRAKNEKQKAMDSAYNFCEPASLRDKYFSHEHHDLIVGKDYRGIL